MNIEFESDDEQDERKIIFNSTTTALESQEHLQQLSCYFLGIAGLNMLVNTLKGIEIQMQMHMHQVKTSQQLSILYIFQHIDDVYLPCRIMKTDLGACEGLDTSAESY